MLIGQLMRARGMQKTAILLLCVLILCTSAWGQDRDASLRDCPTVQVCLETIEKTLPEKDNGRIFGDEQQVAIILKARFGREARDELLQKAVGNHGGWRNYAGGVLRYWGDWSEDDLPILKKALELNPGGSVAHVLAEIGSELAIRILFDDLVRSGGANQTGAALRNLGPSVLNYALPALSAPSYDELPEGTPYTEGWTAAASLIRSFGSRATFIADEWIALANMSRAKSPERIAALRGLAAMNGYLGDRSASLHRLLRSRNREIADQAFATLVSTYDPIVARRFATACKPTGRKWDEYVFDSFDCLSPLSDFGSNAMGAGDLLLPFLDAPNKSEQLYGIEALGLIGYEPAIAKIETFLEAPDWRLVYASVRALGQMRSRASIPKIESAVQNHWLWELNSYAERTVSLLARNQPYSELMADPWGLRFYSGFGNYSAPYDGIRECEWQVWTYHGERITFDQDKRNRINTVSFPDGELVGTDRGEFGGNLVWKPKNDAESIVVNDNTIDIFPIDNGFISIHGISHMTISYGFAAYITREEDGSFVAEEVARFPAAAYKVKELADGLFAANAGGRVFIFSKDGVKDAAYCDQSAKPDETN